MDRLPRAGGVLSAVAGVSACLIVAAGWPAETTAQVFGDTTERVSVASDGTESNGSSNFPAISADGRFVGFESRASNLVTGDTNDTNDIFVHDRQTGSTERVSVASDGVEANDSSGGPVALSADGRFVAFTSWASNLVAGDTNDQPDVFVRDRQTETTERVSVASNGTEGNDAGSYVPAISADGRFVAFFSEASNLVANDTNFAPDIFVHDRQTGMTERVNVASDGTQANGFNYVGGIYPAISADGRFVAFVSWASNLVADDTNHTGDVFVRDRQTGTTERVSVASDGTEANDESEDPPAISADGRFVAFWSYASNLYDGDVYGTPDLFVHDRQTGTTERVSAGESPTISISADGRFVAFGSGGIFIYDRQTGTTERVSVANGGGEANGNSRDSAISADGRYVAFGSEASNLVADDTNHEFDIFVRFTAPPPPPVAPVARADGPYTFCANVGTLVLDGTGSFNPDEGASESGFPGDTIQAYEWDLDGDGAFDDAAGAQPDVTGFFDTAPAGKHTVALKVTDTTATSFPSSGLGDLSGVDSAEVTVFGAGEPSCACVTNLAARVKSGKVQLTWTDVGAPGGYRVYRAELPNGQSHAVATVPPGYLYVDSNVVNGRSYGYALVTIAENGAETCPSNPVIATPRGR